MAGLAGQAGEAEFEFEEGHSPSLLRMFRNHVYRYIRGNPSMWLYLPMCLGMYAVHAWCVRRSAECPTVASIHVCVARLATRATYVSYAIYFSQCIRCADAMAAVFSV